MIPKESRHRRIRNLPIWLGLVISLALVVFAILLERVTTASAQPGDLVLAEGQYPNMLGSRIDTCVLCHTSSIPSLNPFGIDYRANGRSASALVAIQNLDSDGDGFTNLQEINALTFPGNANDIPAAATQAPTATATLGGYPPPEATATLTATLGGYPPPQTRTAVVNPATNTPTPVVEVPTDTPTAGELPSDTPMVSTDTMTPTSVENAPTVTNTRLPRATRTPTHITRQTRTPTPRASRTPPRRTRTPPPHRTHRPTATVTCRGQGGEKDDGRPLSNNNSRCRGGDGDNDGDDRGGSGSNSDDNNGSGGDSQLDINALMASVLSQFAADSRPNR